MFGIPQPPHEFVPFPPARLAAIDFISEARQQNTVYGLVECDVSYPWELIRAHRRAAREALSFTAYAIRCVAKAVDEWKSMHACRWGHKGVALFEEVDVSTLVERTVAGVRHPTLQFITSANRKPFHEIHLELESQRGEVIDPRELSRERRTGFLKFPRFLRRWMLRKLRYNPFAKKFAAGTVGVTSLNMYAPPNNYRRGWILPISPWTLTIGLGLHYRAPVAIGDQVVIREMLPLTLCFDHDLIDGAPAARFNARLLQYLESGFELPGGPATIPPA